MSDDGRTLLAAETHILRPGGELQRFGRTDVARILHDNMLKYGCVNDHVVTFEPGRLG